MKIVSTPQERALARKLTNERCKYKEKLGIPTGRVDSSRSNRDITYLGFMAEILVSRVLDVPFSTELYAGQDPGVDLIWEGLKIQIKCSFYHFSDLKIRNGKHLRENKPLAADVFILVKPVFREKDCWDLSFIYKEAALPLIQKVQLQKGSGLLELVPKENLKSLSVLVNSKIKEVDWKEVFSEQ